MAGFLHQLLGSGDDPLQYLISLLDPQDRPKTPPGGSLPAAPSPSQVFTTSRYTRHPNRPQKVGPTAPSDDSSDPVEAYLAAAPNTTYGEVLPLASDKTTGKLRFALPNMLRSTALGIIDLMRATAGESRPWTDSDIADPRLTPNAMMAMTGLAGAPMREAAEMPVFLRAVLPRAAEDSTASRAAQIYNPTPRPPRPFEADYPSRAPADAAGNLTKDIEGRPLTAP